ncbi:MAG: acyl-CoA thioesterase [Alphaproteobacteria bacterium]|nr:acyl-CoA thioesterase [Alphaproteobacteria bacterium]
MAKHRFNFSIAYADTDAGGIVYHGRYIEIAERARMNWLKGKNIPHGDNFIIKNLNIDYKSPLRLGEDIWVETDIIKVGNVSLDMVQQFIGASNKLAATLNSKVAYVGPDMRLKAIPQQLYLAMLACMGRQHS